MAEPARKLMTADEFLAFNGEGDTRYQLFGGVVVAMAPPADAHGTIVANASFEIGLRLRGKRPCRSVVEAGVRIDEYNHYKADAVATCAEPDGSVYVREPFLVVEVLSPSTANDDLAVKLPRYLDLPSVREVWIIDSRERWVQVWRSSENRWAVPLPLRGSASFRSDVLDDEIALDQLYLNAPL